MITGMEIAACQHMAVPAEVMQHIVNVESGYNPFAIGVVGGQLARQPKNLGEALATVHMLDAKGYNYSLGVAQVNRANFAKYGLASYEQAFDVCPNLTAGARILSQCYASSGNDWGKSFSCYYSGNFTTGFRDGYVQKIYDSIRGRAAVAGAAGAPITTAIPLKAERAPSSLRGADKDTDSVIAEDRASHRLAIRSTPLGNTISGPITAPGVAPAAEPDTQASAPLAASAPENTAPPNNNAEKGPNAVVATAAPTGVFEPQVRSLGEAAAPPPAASGQPQIAAATTPLAPATDGVVPQQGVHDDAFVF